LREFVLAPVILTPDARGREGPGGDFLHRFVWIVLDWLDPVDPADCSKLGFRLRETLLLLNGTCHLFQDRGLWRVRRCITSPWPCHAMAMAWPWHGIAMAWPWPWHGHGMAWPWHGRKYIHLFGATIAPHGRKSRCTVD
jgi:hypothetical protein